MVEFIIELPLLVKVVIFGRSGINSEERNYRVSIGEVKLTLTFIKFKRTETENCQN